MSTEIATITASAAPEQTASTADFYTRDSEERLWTTSMFPEHLFQKGYVVGGTARSLMRLSIALACMDVISQDVAKVPIQMRRYLKNRRGSVLVDPSEHPVARLLDRRPSRYYGWGEFKRIMTLFLACSSEYFVLARRRTNGDLYELQGVDRSKCEPLVNSLARRYFYDVRPSSDHDYAQFGWAEGRRSEDDVAHIRTRSLDGMTMQGNARIAATAFEIMSKMQTYQTNIFSNGGMGAKAFLFPDRMTDEQFARLEAGLLYSREKAIREGKPFILEGNGTENGMPKVVDLTASSVDTDFVKANEAAAIDICRTFRVPPHKVYLLNSVKYDNQAEQDRQYVEASLVPIFQAIAECLEVVVLTEAEREDFCLSFDMDAAAGMDPKTRQEVYEKRWKSGMIEYDEMREGIGYNAVGGEAGQARMISGNFMLVDRDNNVLLKAGGNAPGAEGDQAPQEEAGGAGSDKGLASLSNVVPIR